MGTPGMLWATLGPLTRALDRPEVAPERSWVTPGTLWATPGRLLVHFWSLLVPKSSSKGGLGGSKKYFFLKIVMFHDLSVGVVPDEHQGIENPSIFGTKIDPKSTTASTFTPGCSFSSSGMTFGLPWSAFRFSWITFGPLWATFGALQCSKSAPRGPQGYPKSTPRVSRGRPRASQEHPKRPSDAQV